MSWLYSRGLVEEFLEANCLDGEQFVPLNGMPMPQAFCSQDKMTDFLKISRSGMIFKPLMADHGEELLKWYLGAFHVQTSALLEGELDSMENNRQCGITWRGWLAKFDPDSYSWKTAQCSFIEESGESLLTFPVSGMTRDGLLWELSMLEHRISVTERGLWRTPDTGGGGVQKQLSEGKNHRASGHLIQIRLQDQVNNPRLWPTPVQRMYKDNASPSEYERNEIPLAAQVGGPLNPEWVEWLMGWPVGWTDLKPLEMDKFHLWQQQHGKF